MNQMEQRARGNEGEQAADLRESSRDTQLCDDRKGRKSAYSEQKLRTAERQKS